MAYFLKKTQRKNGLYLQIYSSYYDPEKGASRHKCIKTIGYEPKLKESGIENPVDYYTKEVEKMNKKRTAEIAESKAVRIAGNPKKNIGYFLAKGIINKLAVESDLKVYNMVREFDFSVPEMLEALIYSRIITPASKLKTWTEVIPYLYGDYDFSLDQVYKACEFFGEEYERIIEVFNHHINTKYGRKTDKVYFDCTNYYFEIDHEFEDKQKGPSKERRTDPIISMALMLDKNQIPIGMKMFPGNESEKPQLRNMIKDLKERNNITGKTIQVADKGLNCAENICEALRNGDGYIFSKSVKKLPAQEKEWLFLENDQWKDVLDDDGILQYRYKECVDDFNYEILDKNGKKTRVSIPEKRLATYNPRLAKKQLIEIGKLADKAATLTKSKAKKSEYGEASKYTIFSSLNQDTGEVSDGSDVVAVLNNKKIEEDKKLAGYNLLVTSEIQMAPLDIYGVYHNLWKIEESFRVLKSQLDARPVYLQKKHSIYGHFLICYLSVTILRLIQYVEFKDKLCVNAIIEFMRNLECVPNKKQIINMASFNKVKPVDDLLKSNLNLTHFYLTDREIRKLLSFSF